MIQRIQTVYLALAVILLVLCCCMPLACFEPNDMGFPSVMYSLVLLDGDGAIKGYSPIPLFVISVITEVILVFAIMGYGNRRKQMSTCSIAIVTELLWVIVYAVLCLHLKEDDGFGVKIAASFPVIAIILTAMARRQIKKDDDLVRSADRIR